MFKELIPDKRANLGGIGRRGALVSVSLLMHLAVVLAIVVGPLMHAETRLPVLQISDINIGQLPPAPGIPHSHHGAKGKLVGPKHPHPPGPTAGRPYVLRVPDTIPTEIPKENWDSPAEPAQEEIPGAPEGPEGPQGPGQILPGPQVDAGAPALRVTEVKKPKLVRKISPVYPDTARLTRTQGVVLLEAATDIFGRVRSVKVLSGNSLLNEAAVEAVRQWLYEPYLVNGVPKAVLFTVTVTFALETE